MRYLLLLLIGCFPIGVLAQGNKDAPLDAERTLSAFERMLPVTVSVTIPTVVDIPVSDPVFRVHDAVVYEETTKRFVVVWYRQFVF
jgi:hypothetical protein